MSECLIEAAVWPRSTRVLPDGDVAIGGVPLQTIATTFGTPSYVLDLAEFDSRCMSYLNGADDMEIAYAGKALLTRSVARTIDRHGMSLDVCSEGELELALSADFPARRIILHGNAKPRTLLRRAVVAGVGRIVVDSLDEIELLASLTARRGGQRVLVRVTPDIDAGTHPAITTGTEDQKFGLSLSSGAAATAIRRVQAAASLELTGIHCHLGSQITNTEPYERAVRRLVDFLAELRGEVSVRELNVGGGHAIAYTADDTALPAAAIASALRNTVAIACARHGLEPPHLTLEPGRAIAGPSGVTLYRVLGVKRTAATTWVTVDGGMSDNPRPALYGARYTARLAGRESSAAPEPVTIVGMHCESGDLLAENVLMASDIQTGDLIAVPATGAYHYAMASNYNMTPRPPLIGVRGGRSRVLVRRETVDDLMLRDVG